MKDHHECIATTGTPVVRDPNLVIPNEQDYRRCLMARGWQRVDKFQPSGPYYRGYEERELGPIKINPLLREQPPPKGSRPVVDDGPLGFCLRAGGRVERRGSRDVCVLHPSGSWWLIE